jgi:hypothetical protein
MIALGCATTQADVPANLVAHYSFDEGAGDVLHDSSGNGHDGRIVGAQWVAGDPPSLHFSGHGDYVDFGAGGGPRIAGDSTVLAWVRLDASPFPDDATNWTILDCEDYRREGFLLRIDGGSSRVMYRANQAGADQNAFGTTVLENHTVHFIGAATRVDDTQGTATLYVNGTPDAEFAVKRPVLGSAPFRISTAGQSFNGAILELMIFDRALDEKEIMTLYWDGVARHHKDGVQRGQLRITPHVYYAEKQALAEIDFLGVMPLATEERVEIALAKHDGTPITSQTVIEIPREGRGEYTFPLDGLASGTYQLGVRLTGGSRSAEASATFDYPSPPAAMPSPETLTIESLPHETPAPPHKAQVTADGTASVTVGDKTFPIESAFSVPDGGSNQFGGTLNATGETEWQPAVTQPDASSWEIKAQGKQYAVSRRMTSEPGRVLVSDTITNLTDAPIGLIFHNRLSIPGDQTPKAYIAGKETGTPAERDIKTCPTVFLSYPGLGVGMAALDDVYIVQARGALLAGSAIDLFSREFALDSKASYALEWAIYLNATGDYFDLINAIRRDEHRNNVTVDGTLGFIPGSQHKREAGIVPTDGSYYDLRNLRYFTAACLSWCTDDPEISVEGIEFIEHPQERRQVRAMMDVLRAARPEVKGMFHIAHQLFATNRPDDHYPDSKVIDAQGNHTVYPNDYANSSYFSRRRYEENWRWWIYYPTLENSFGRALLDSVDVMMDEMGAQGVFADGFLWGYGGEYTYDRWDGHSADIDPKTQTITRQKASVPLITQDAMIAWCRKIWGKGGTVIANGVIPTRTICSVPIITDKEVTEGPDVPLLPTPCTLGNPGTFKSERDVYRDVLSKLRWGNLYCYYGEPALTHASAPAQMYPITVQEVHAGCVKGKERIVTMHSGVYGWQDSRDLHFAYRYDSRGRRIDPGYVTAVDAGSVRTRVELADHEIAILARIPVRIESEGPVNLAVRRFDADGIVIILNGHSPARIILPDGEEHPVVLNGQQELSFPRK